MTPALFIHGGAGRKSERSREKKIRASLREILEQAHKYLLEESALNTVLFTVALLENDPLYNAGTGSTVQADGKIRMSASVMDGAKRRFAGVINIESVRNPVLVAAELLGKPDRVLEGKEALAFARSAGFKRWDPMTPERYKNWKRWKEQQPGTVGAVAVDRFGRVAAATSTGGKLGAHAGRVSDSCTPAGNYASPLAAVSCTGLGEDILDEAAAARLVGKSEEGKTLRKAFGEIFGQLEKRKRALGAIGVDSHGRLSWGNTMPRLYAAGRSARGRIETF